jgi:hypothetical protein
MASSHLEPGAGDRRHSIAPREGRCPTLEVAPPGKVSAGAVPSSHRPEGTHRSAGRPARSKIKRWSKFDWTDFEADIPLRMCSAGAQGLWWRLLAFMHRAETRGHLAVGGKPLSLRQISGVVRFPSEEVERLMHELEAAGVFSRSSERVLYNRRMVRESRARALGQKNGRLGGNPVLLASGKAQQSAAKFLPVNPCTNPKVKTGRTRKIRTANSPSGAGDAALPSLSTRDLEQAAFDAWNALAAATNVKAARLLAPDRRLKLRKRLAECGGLDGWQYALEQVRNSDLWQGLVPGRNGGPGWVGSFDDILSPSKFRRLMEGCYTQGQMPTIESRADRLIREGLEEIERQMRTIDGGLA